MSFEQIEETILLDVYSSLVDYNLKNSCTCSDLCLKELSNMLKYTLDSSLVEIVKPTLRPANRTFETVRELSDFIENYKPLLKTARLHNYYQNFIWLVFDADSVPVNKLDVARRYYLFNKLYGLQEKVVSVQAFSPIIADDSNDLSFDQYKIEDDFFNPAVSKETLEKIVNDVSKLEGLSYALTSSAESIDDVIGFEVISMLMNSINLRKCKNCGDYFVLNNLNQEYCNNIPLWETKPCNEIGPNRSFKKRLEKDEGLRLYNSAYKTRYSRYMRGKLTRAALNDWMIAAKQKLDWVKTGEISIDNYSNWLKNK